MIPFTTVVAVDQVHLRELVQVLPTWQRFRSELFRQPFKLLCATEILDQPDDQLQVVLKAHPDVEIIPVPPTDHLDQRARMLTALTLLAPWVVQTPWLLKIDTDTLAKWHTPTWCHEMLLEGDPVFVAHPWGYTKPAHAIQRLDDWADTIPELRNKPRLNLPFDPTSRIIVTRGRIISFVFFGRVDWLRWTSTLCRQLPVPSHDTYTWFIARRNGDFYRTVNMKNQGWHHGGRSLEWEVQKVLAETEP